MATSIEIWSENLPAYEVFNSMGTQWAAGMSGVTGLNYCALESVMRLRSVPVDDWPQLFDDVRTMEGAALEVMRQE